MTLSPPLLTIPPSTRPPSLLASTTWTPKTPPRFASRFPPARCSMGADVPITADPLRSSSPSSSSSSSSPSSSPYVAASEEHNPDAVEEELEKIVYRCRFLAILAVFGSLVGSLLCFVKGCTYVLSSFQEYFVNRAKVIILLVEAIDIYLLGTVMLVFGMGLYELFVSNIDTAKLISGEKESSNLFGLFALKERPKWLEIKTVNELKTKLGHVIVMLLLIGFFEKSKTAVIHTPVDLLYFSASVLLCSGCLYLLSTLKESKS